MIDLTIVIPSYEAQDCLTECLAAIRDAERAHPELALEVIVVDNGSRDESLARARESVLAPRLIAWVRNRGFAAAANFELRTEDATAAECTPLTPQDLSEPCR